MTTEAQELTKASITVAYERMIARAEPAGKCLLWTGGTNTNGYAVVRVGRRLMLGHRLAFLHRHGWLPPVVRHDCDTPSCLADACHVPGSQADNVADMIAKGRMRIVHPPGEANGQAKLTERQVREMRRLAAQGRPASLLAPRFGVSHSAACDVIARRTWAHVA